MPAIDEDVAGGDEARRWAKEHRNGGRFFRAPHASPAELLIMRSADPSERAV